MPSSKLHSRKITPRKPACVRPCPQPIDWPPNQITGNITAQWGAPWNPWQYNADYAADRQGESWMWHEYTGPAWPSHDISITIDPQTSTAHIAIKCWHTSGNWTAFERHDFPIEWGVPKLYTITQWDVADSSLVATVTMQL